MAKNDPTEGKRADTGQLGGEQPAPGGKGNGVKSGIHFGFMLGGVFSVWIAWLSRDALLALLGGLVVWINCNGWRYWRNKE